MFALNLLGGAALSGVNGPVDGKAAHKRRIALLAILAVARGRTVGRERIIGLLWADHRTAAARHLLSESLYVLRKELGADAFISAGDEVGLNGAVVQSDVEEFEREVEQGELERAAQLYRGPFLDGFFIPGAAEFEQWTEGERARLARAHSRALECLADTCEREGRPEQAVEWWRRLTVLDPSNTRVGMRLMTALEAAGERAAALWFALSHVAYLDTELGVEPDDDFLDLVDRLKTDPVPPPQRPRPAAAPAPVIAAEADPPPVAAPVTVVLIQVPEGGAAGDAGKPAASGNGGTGTRMETDVAVDPAEKVEATAGDADTADTTDVIDAADPTAAGDVKDAADETERREIGGAIAAADPAPPPAGEEAAGADAAGGGGIGGAEQEERFLAGVPAGPVASSARTEAPRPAPRRWRQRIRAGAVAGTLMGAVLAFPRGREEPPPVAGGYDPRRIAVLYFDDDSRGGELGYLATGLTESLIHSLSQVSALEVISRNGVKPYRDGAVPFGRMVGDLQAGTVVEGSVQRSGDSVRVTVVLVDTRTQARMESRTLTEPVGDVFALQDALADSVSVFLRRRVGAEVQLRRTGEETRSATAWRLVQEARQVADDAASLQRADDPLARDAVLRLLDQADSLLAEAERADPDWTRPTVQRGWIALRRAPLVRGTAASRVAALAYAQRALARRPDDPLARELRGNVLFDQALATVDSAGQAARVAGAERDLRAAVAAEPTLASGWNRLSQVLRYQGRAAESEVLTRRALQEDAWLEDANVILARLYFAALYAADYPRARALCAQGGRRFPADWRFVECRLTLLRAAPSRPADADAVRALLTELDRVDPPDHARRDGRPYSPAFRRAVAAAVLARAGQTDSARAMLARARREAGGDPAVRLSLAYDEAAVYQLMGHPDTARALLEWTFTRRPAQRAFAARDPLFNRRPGGAGTASRTP
jgi:DNA-binding SARP family transcriptional activator/TolB-like protein